MLSLMEYSKRVTLYNSPQYMILILASNCHPQVCYLLCIIFTLTAFVFV